MVGRSSILPALGTQDVSTPGTQTVSTWSPVPQARRPGAQAARAPIISAPGAQAISTPIVSSPGAQAVSTAGAQAVSSPPWPGDQRRPRSQAERIPADPGPLYDSQGNQTGLARSASPNVRKPQRGEAIMIRAKRAYH